MAGTVLLLLVFMGVLPATIAQEVMDISLPVTGCTKEACAAYTVGYYKGVYMPGPRDPVGNVNYDTYAAGVPMTGDWKKSSTSSKCLADCCEDCRTTAGCKMFQFWPAESLSSAPIRNTQCYLLKDTTKPCGSALNWVGGFCNPTPDLKSPPPRQWPSPPPPPPSPPNPPPPQSPPPNSPPPVLSKPPPPVLSKPPPPVVTSSYSPPPPGVKGDPHFTGWDGVHFDFTGQPGKSYCLLSDSNVHVNMYLDGHRAKFNGSSKTFSWIKGVGVVSENHKLGFFARDGADPVRGSGYLKRMVADGKDFSLKEGEKFQTADGEVIVAYLGHKIDGNDDVDMYTVEVVDSLKLLLKMRPEIQEFRIPTDSWVHFSIEVLDEQLSKNPHGILGQTLYNYYNPESAPAGYAVEYSGIVWAWQVVGADAEPYIQGKPNDYATSNVLATDCKFSRFAKKSFLQSALALSCWRTGFVC